MSGRIGLGCMRLGSSGASGAETILAALDAGIVVFDTARAYPGSEELLGRVLASDPRGASALVVTKCGMRRPDGRWQPDGRAQAVLDDARRSVDALGRAPDVLLLHAPDPRVPLAVSVRALARAREEGLARAVGLSNVSRKQLTEASDITAIAAIQVALGAYDDVAARGGVVAWCAAHAVRLYAHSPLGGPSKAPRLAGDARLRALAGRHGVDVGTLVLAYLLAVSAVVVPLVGTARPERVVRAARAAELVLSDDDLVTLDARFPSLGALRRPSPSPGSRGPARSTREVVMVMGIAGAGKSRLAATWTARGYERLNRDAVGGTLKGIVKRLEERLDAGVDHVVLDNTYVTRASRADVVRVAHARGASVRCVHLEIGIGDAQVNVVTRMLERHGELLGGDALRARAKSDPNMVGPGTLFRMLRELEPPSEDEGFASIERVPFVRDPPSVSERPGAALPFELTDRADVLARLPPGVPLLVFGWRLPSSAPATIADLEHRSGRTIDLVSCPHGDGPPVCWCRPPLPGAWLWFARRRGVGRHGSFVVASGPTHRAMAKVLGVSIVESD